MILTVIIAGIACAALIGGQAGLVKNTGLITKGIKSNFFERFQAMQTIEKDIATRITSDSDQEVYKWLGSMPRMRAMGTGVLPQGLRGESYTIENEEYEVSLEVKRSEREDDQTGQLAIRAQEMGQVAATHKAKLCADLLKAGENADALAYDGKPFFSTTHESGDSGAQSNVLTIDISAAVPGEPDTPNAPSAKTLQYAFQQMLAAMMGFKDDRGEPMDITPTGLVICTNPQNLITWDVAVNGGIVNNTTNVLAKYRPVILPMARLTTLDEHYLLKCDEAVRPLIDQHREDVRIETLEEGSDHEVKTGNLLYVAKARYRMAYGKWFYAVKVKFD